MEKKHGGKREGSGKKPKYGEATITVAFRVPESKAEEIKALVQSKLLEYSSYTERQAETPSVKVSPELSNHIESIQKADEVFESMRRDNITFPDLIPDRLLKAMDIKYPCGCIQESKLFRRDKKCKLPKDRHNGKD